MEGRSTLWLWPTGKKKKIYNVGRAFILLKGLLFKPAVEFNDTAVSFPTRLVKSLNTDRNSKIGKNGFLGLALFNAS